jgi:hypothetical protein
LPHGESGIGGLFQGLFQFLPDYFEVIFLLFDLNQIGQGGEIAQAGGALEAVAVFEKLEEMEISVGPLFIEHDTRGGLILLPGHSQHDFAPVEPGAQQCLDVVLKLRQSPRQAHLEFKKAVVHGIDFNREFMFAAFDFSPAKTGHTSGHRRFPSKIISTKLS